MKYNVYQKERIGSDLWVLAGISNWMLKTDSNALAILSSLHHLHIGWLSL
jgi:hypothetical protein